MTEIKRVCDLTVSDYQKMILTLCAEPKTTYQLAAKLKKSYSSISQNLGILRALNLISKIETMSGKTIYVLKDNIKA
jgi:predicted transcriptional regulator